MIPIKIDIAMDLPPDVSRRKWREWMRGAHEENAVFHQRVHMRLHFGENASGRYGYRERSRNYSRRKDRMRGRGLVVGGGRSSLVYTGLLRTAILGAYTVRAYPTRAILGWSVPQYARINYRQGRVQIAKELLTVNASEAKTLGERMLKHTGEKLKRYRSPRTARIH